MTITEKVAHLKGFIEGIELDESIVDPTDVEMLEDLLVAAVNEALEKVDAETTSAMSKFTGGMGGGMEGGPGGGGGPAVHPPVDRRGGRRDPNVPSGLRFLRACIQTV